LVLFLEVLYQTKRSARVHEIFKPFPFCAAAQKRSRKANRGGVTLSNELMYRNRCDRRTDGQIRATHDACMQAPYSRESEYLVFQSLAPV